MDGVMNKNQLTVAEEFEFDKPLIHKIVYIVENCIKNCHNK